MTEHYSDHAHASLPSRRERLQLLLKLKSQRQLLIAAIAALAALSAALAAGLYRDRSTAKLVKLGKGVASVDARPVSALKPLLSEKAANTAPVATSVPLVPVPSESPFGDGVASYYGDELAGNPTANGEIFDPERLTAAHRTLPLGSKVRVTDTRNGKSVVVRINDRGPFHGNRVIDLSTAAARNIGLIRSGTGRVSMALFVQ